ncbi:MAG: hypothetical protein J6J62_10025, partial [Oscillospiraceae bacterium]|nr:hypothetical protein [Oscillospiraceae bacterium]
SPADVVFLHVLTHAELSYIILKNLLFENGENAPKPFDKYLTTWFNILVRSAEPRRVAERWRSFSLVDSSCQLLGIL